MVLAPAIVAVVNRVFAKQFQWLKSEWRFIPKTDSADHKSFAWLWNFASGDSDSLLKEG